jgi:ABC-type transport system substrate-binding protein
LELAPFRYALELIVGCEKDVWITDIYGYINVRLDTTVPPANVYWYNPEITPYPEDWDQACEMLYAAGFTGTPGGNDWIMPNHVPLVDRVADPVLGTKGIFVMSPDSAPTSMEVTRRHVKKWNMFFCGVEGADWPAPAPLFHHEPINVNVESDVAFINRDFDMYMLCWGLSKYPTSLYWFFATETDLPDVNQGPGLSYRPLDALLVSFYYCMWTDYLQGKWIGPGPVTVTGSTTKATKYKFVDGTEELWIGHISMAPDFPFYVAKLEKDVDYEVVKDGSGNGVSIHFLNDIDIPEDYYIHIVYKLVTPVPINDINEMRRMCWDTQWMLYYACPYLPIYSRNYHDLYKPGLICWVPSLGYGSGSYQLKWTYASVHWTGTEVGGSVRWHNPGQCFTFHPWLAAWVYEVTILNRIYDGMIETDAFTHADIPWCALDYKLEDWTGPSGEAGMIVKYWIRNDLKWQDGDPITVDDFIWEYEFINSIKAPDYFGTWSTYHGCIKYSDYCFGIKVNATGRWKFLDYTIGPVYPEKIWKYFWGDKAGAEAFKPWETVYTTYVPPEEQGPTPPPTCLYGTAEWIFDYHDWVLGITRLYKNVNGWARAAATPCRQIAGIYPVSTFAKNNISINTKTVIGLYKLNLDTKESCIHTWVLKVDGIIVATGPETLTPLQFHKWLQELPALKAGLHTFTLELTNAYGTNVYTTTIHVLIGDTNDDRVVDMADISYLVDLFLREAGMKGYDGNGDINCDDIIDMADISICIDHFLEEI